MRRHPADLGGLIFGTAFTIAGVAFLVNELTDKDISPAWAVGLGLMLLGAVALIATLVRGLRAHDDEHEHGSYQHAYAQYSFVGDDPRDGEPATTEPPLTSDE
jgi:hypothetical protein